MDKTTHIGCNVFIIKNNKLLLGLRKNMTGEGTWGLVGGHLEYGELMHEAAQRELFEETGIKAEKLEFLNVINSIQEKAHYIQVNFILRNFEGEVKNMEPDYCGGLEYFDLDNLPENILFGHQASIKSFKENQVYV